MPELNNIIMNNVAKIVTDDYLTTSKKLKDLGSYINNFHNTKEKIDLITKNMKECKINKPMINNYFEVFIKLIENDIKNNFISYLDRRDDVDKISYLQFKESLKIINSTIFLISAQEWNKIIKNKIENKDYIFLMGNNEIELINKKELVGKTKLQNNLISDWVIYRKFKTLNNLIKHAVKDIFKVLN